MLYVVLSYLVRLVDLFFVIYFGAQVFNGEYAVSGEPGPTAPACPRGCSSPAPHPGRSTLVGEKSPPHNVDVKCSSGPHTAPSCTLRGAPAHACRQPQRSQQHWPTSCVASLRARCSPVCSSSNSPPAAWGRMRPSFHGGTTSLQGAGSSAPGGSRRRGWKSPVGDPHFRRPSDHLDTRRSWAALVQPPRLTTT